MLELPLCPEVPVVLLLPLWLEVLPLCPDVVELPLCPEVLELPPLGRDVFPPCCGVDDEPLPLCGVPVCPPVVVVCCAKVDPDKKSPPAITAAAKPLCLTIFFTSLCV